VFGLGIQIERELADVVSPIGEEGDLLVHLHPLGAKDLEQPPLRLGVMRLHEGEALGRAVGWHALASDDLEPAIASGALLAGVHVATVQANRQR